MKIIDELQHPEVNELIHICAVSADLEGHKELCDLMKKNVEVKPPMLDKSEEEKKKKEDKELDDFLMDTFPASDPIAHYE